MFEELYEKAMKDQAANLEKLTKEQFEKCLLEAIKSQDFMQHIQYGFEGTTIAFSYIPYREYNNLKNKINDLKNTLRHAKSTMESDFDSGAYNHTIVMIDEALES